MQENIQPEEFETKIATELDAWITARFAEQGQLASLSNLDPQTVDLTALAQDLLSLAEGIQPNHDFLLNLEAKLRRKVLTENHLSVVQQPTLKANQVESNHRNS
ncbi:hypothetical protein QUB80_32615 [Chlorogloeopsis sp. ULAP01]|uniref:hypothetical protein n=1 Tax=Chlorogloeopsis sp. ULAP01 TaxID=3056483 RepID=UPI0025AA52F9|nr:hypothetical protein [Chlorogloeopsis sp. ULAP01]MDM9385399.1 hypothetical protein [Chlorogloeopsis sp. ULAP01]